MKLKKSSLRRNHPRTVGKTYERTTVRGVAQVIDNKIDRHPGHEVTVVTAPPRLRPKNPFAILFFQTLSHYLLCDLIGLVEVKVLLLLLNAADSENIVLRLSQKDLALAIGVNQSTVSRAFARLLKTHFILANESGSYVINPQLITRSSLRKVKETTGYKLNAANVQKWYPGGNDLFDNF